MDGRDHREKGSEIQALLEDYRPGSDFGEQVASLLEAEDPQDLYHAVVSSSFDADRLDYLRRDRLMTGVGTGAIDFDWLLEHVVVRPVMIEAADGTEEGDFAPAQVLTFCLDSKALGAAEQFLLARYTLHKQVYFHKTTRCIETIIARLFRRVGELADEDAAATQAGLDSGHPIWQFFSDPSPSVAKYLALDDVTVLGALDAMSRAPDPNVADLAGRLRNRRLYKTLDLSYFGHEEGRQRMFARRIDKIRERRGFGGAVLKDESATVNIYTQIGGDDERMHKKLHLVDSQGVREITEYSDIIRALSTRRVHSILFREGRRSGARHASRRVAMASLEREKIVVAILSAAGGEVIGRVRLQKMAYLLSRLGLGTGLRFDYHHYGPFSRELENAVEDAKAFNCIEEVRQARVSDGALFSRYKLKVDAECDPTMFSGLSTESASQLLDVFSGTNVTVLELAATVDWLRTQERVDDWQSEIRKRKGRKVENGRLEKAVELLEEIGLSTVKPLDGS